MQSPRSFETYSKDGEESTHAKWIQDLLKLVRHGYYCDTRVVYKTCPHNVFSPSFEESVLIRDAHCFIAGTESKSDLGVLWIVPPAYVHKVLAL